MYDLVDVFPDAELDPGTNLLVTGPSLSGKRRLTLEILARGTRNGEGAIVVTTKDGANRILGGYADLVGDVDDVPLAIVDCVTKQQGAGGAPRDERVRYASSPVDMTGIGVNLSEAIEEFHTKRGLERNRILLDSVSTLLMYSNVQTVFRFLHVFTGRVQNANALGVYVMDSTAHDDRTKHTIIQLFDGIVEMGDDEERSPTLRLSA